MLINYRNLDEKTRKYMMQEFEFDINQDRLFFSRRFNEAGEKLYPTLLQEAILNHDDSWLAKELNEKSCFNSHEQRKNKLGSMSIVRVPINASETFSEGEFNRFYCRGLCQRAIEEGRNEVIVYRGKIVINPRPESEMMIGKGISPSLLLEDLRNSQGVEPVFGVPSGPNSGLSIYLD